MWELKISKQFKKDLKKYQNKPKQITQLKKVLATLKENDTLLIWLDEVENLIKLIRLGSHSELFK